MRRRPWGCFGNRAPYTDIHLRVYGGDRWFSPLRGSVLAQPYDGSWPYYAVAATHVDSQEDFPESRSFGIDG